MTFFLIALLVLFILFTLFQRKRQQKRRDEMLTTMVPGAEVMTTTGIYGTLRSLEPETNKAIVEVADGVYLTVHPGILGQPLPKPNPANVSSVQPEEAGRTPEVPDDASSLSDLDKKNPDEGQDKGPTAR